MTSATTRRSPIRSRTRPSRAAWSISSKHAWMSPSSTHCVGAGREHVDLGDRVAGRRVGRTHRTTDGSPAFEDRFEDQLHAGLNDPIRRGRDPQRTQTCPFALGIIRCRTGNGVNCPDLRSRSSPVQERRFTEHEKMERRLHPIDPGGSCPPISLAPDPTPPWRNAGSATRLNRSSNRRRPSSTEPIGCSLVLDLPVLASSASTRLGHDASVFTGVLLAFQHPHCELAGSLRHVHGFPVLALLRTLRPIPGPSADGEPARRPAGCRSGRATQGWFPRSPCPGRPGRRPALPLQPRHRRSRRHAAMASSPLYDYGFGVADPVASGQRALLPGPHPPGWSRFHT